MSEKGQKLRKTTKVGKKEPKIGPKWSFERFLSVFRPYKYNKNWIVQRPGAIRREVGTADMKFVP
jgi:hypothetical protein